MREALTCVKEWADASVAEWAASLAARKIAAKAAEDAWREYCLDGQPHPVGWKPASEWRSHVSELLDTRQRARRQVELAVVQLQRAEFEQGKIDLVLCVRTPT
jgi:hypothetical protein